MNSNLYQHFRKSERPFIDYVGGLVSRSVGEYRPILTHFLNPRQCYILQVVVNGSGDIQIKFSGGYPDAEMKRALIFPRYFKPKLSDFNLALVQVKYPLKFVNLRHSQILGTLMSCGIERKVVGDIVTDGRHWQFWVEKSLLSYLLVQIHQINRNRVKLIQVSVQKMVHPRSDWRNQFVVISSLRIDNVIATSFNLSRQRAKSLVKHGRVRLNWGTFDQPDGLLQPGDILSIRHFGRVKIRNLNGKSKKGKLKVVISIIKK